MKTFLRFMTEETAPRPTSTTLQRLMGELRLAGLHAGDRNSQHPFVATKSMMALSGAAQRIQAVLLPHGLFMGEPRVVVRESPDTVRAQFDLHSTQDETRRLGEVHLLGELNPIDRGTMQFRVDLKFAPDFLF